MTINNESSVSNSERPIPSDLTNPILSRSYDLLARGMRRVLLSSGLQLEVISERTGIPERVLLDSINTGKSAASIPNQFLEKLFQVCDVSDKDRSSILLYRRRIGDDLAARTEAERLLPKVFVAPPVLPELATPDLDGYEFKPNPLKAQTKEEFLKYMREFHIWAGEVSFREISKRSNRTASASTLCEALAVNASRMPSQKVVKAFIIGCGGTEDDVQQWVTAWRQIRMGKSHGRTGDE